MSGLDFLAALRATVDVATDLREHSLLTSPIVLGPVPPVRVGIFRWPCAPVAFNRYVRRSELDRARLGRQVYRLEVDAEVADLSAKVAGCTHAARRRMVDGLGASRSVLDDWHRRLEDHFQAVLSCDPESVARLDTEVALALLRQGSLGRPRRREPVSVCVVTVGGRKVDQWVGLLGAAVGELDRLGAGRVRLGERPPLTIAAGVSWPAPCPGGSRLGQLVVRGRVVDVGAVTGRELLRWTQCRPREVLDAVWALQEAAAACPSATRANTGLRVTP